MNETNIMDYIPPEQIGYIVAAVMGLIGTIFAALGIFVRWIVGYFAKVQEAKLSAFQQENESRIRDAEAARDIKMLEMQRQLDETQTGRETVRLLFSELSESRKEDAEQRKAFERREAIHIEAMQGIQSNTAATLGILKEMSERLSKHQEDDETMGIRQEKIIAQNEKTHNQNEATHIKLEGITTTLAEIASELKKVTVGRASDRETINDIQEKLSKLQENVAAIEVFSKTPDSVATTTPDATPVTQASEAKDKPDD